MDFTVIMQSKNPNKEKLFRAINSVLAQQTKSIYELIIVCDNCENTWDYVIEEYESELRVGLKLRMLKRDDNINAKWRSICRNDGINAARGKWVLYIDNDDYFTNNYIKQLSSRIDQSKDWYFINDMIWSGNCWKERCANMVMGQCGTANIIHKASMVSRWPERTTYGRDDWQFISNLHSESKNFEHLYMAGYCVCHIPNRYDV